MIHYLLTILYPSPLVKPIPLFTYTCTLKSSIKMRKFD